LVLGWGFGVGRSDGASKVRISEIQDGGLQASWIYKNSNNFAIGLPFEVIFGSRVGFLAELIFLPLIWAVIDALLTSVLRNRCVS